MNGTIEAFSYTTDELLTAYDNNLGLFADGVWDTDRLGVDFLASAEQVMGALAAQYWDAEYWDRSHFSDEGPTAIWTLELRSLPVAS